MKNKNSAVPRVVKDALILFAVTLVAGFLLGLVYTVTLDARTAQSEKEEQEAYQAVFPDGNTFTELEFEAGDAEEALSAAGITSSQASVDKVTSAEDASGEWLGYAITVTDFEGYGGSITMIVGILADGTVSGVSITDISETAGLGMKATDESFIGQYAGVKTDAFEVEKNKSEDAGDNVIDAISGATRTSNAVTNGVNGAIAMFQYLSEAGE
ncbi:MAG: FMN-binding protein [Lachnospiraceae bacterium]|nr:FMN-binding protein [Lachnospiraceae bacterium]